MAKPIVRKPCSKCKQVKPLNEFYKDKSTRDNLNWACKQCEKIRARIYLRTEKGKITTRKKCRKYQQSQRGRLGSAAYRKKNQEKIKAQHAVEYAIFTGKLSKPTQIQCSHCNMPAQEYHHHKGYAQEQWLVVLPVCALCHKAIHKNLSLCG